MEGSIYYYLLIAVYKYYKISRAEGKSKLVQAGLEHFIAAII